MRAWLTVVNKALLEVKVEEAEFDTLFENSKLLKVSNFNFGILEFSTNFLSYPIKTDLSGNTVWQRASVFQKLVKMDHFLINFCPLKM